MMIPLPLIFASQFFASSILQVYLLSSYPKSTTTMRLSKPNIMNQERKSQAQNNQLKPKITKLIQKKVFSFIFLKLT